MQSGGLLYRHHWLVCPKPTSAPCCRQRPSIHENLQGDGQFFTELIKSRPLSRWSCARIGESQLMTCTRARAKAQLLL